MMETGNIVMDGRRGVPDLERRKKSRDFYDNVKAQGGEQDWAAVMGGKAVGAQPGTGQLGMYSIAATSKARGNMMEAGVGESKKSSMPERSAKKGRAHANMVDQESDTAGGDKMSFNMFDATQQFTFDAPRKPSLTGASQQNTAIEGNAAASAFLSALTGEVHSKGKGRLRNAAEIEEFRRVKAAGGEENLYGAFLGDVATHETGAVPAASGNDCTDGASTPGFVEMMAGRVTNKEQLDAHAIAERKNDRDFGGQQESWEYSMGGHQADDVGAAAASSSHRSHNGIITDDGMMGGLRGGAGQVSIKNVFGEQGTKPSRKVRGRKQISLIDEDDAGMYENMFGGGGGTAGGPSSVSTMLDATHSDSYMQGMPQEPGSMPGSSAPLPKNSALLQRMEEVDAKRPRPPAAPRKVSNLTLAGLQRAALRQRCDPFNRATLVERIQSKEGATPYARALQTVRTPRSKQAVFNGMGPTKPKGRARAQKLEPLTARGGAFGF